MTINIESIKHIKITVGNSEVGRISLENNRLSGTSVTTASSMTMTSIDDTKIDSHSIKNVETSLQDDKIDDSMVEWTAKDDETLKAAVNTLGPIGNWERISKHWFQGRKLSFECEFRWENAFQNANTTEVRSSNDSNETDDKSNNKSSSNNNEVALQSSSSKNAKKRSIRNGKSLTQRKRRELEAVEERRLFGKDRSNIETELIHRAYIVGQNNVEKLMRMNAAEKKDKYKTTISFSSVVNEMKEVQPSMVESSRKSNLKSVKKLPRAVLDMDENVVLSPKYNERQEEESAFQDLMKTRGNVLNFGISQLPVEDILEKERNRMRQKDAEEIKRLNPDSEKEHDYDSVTLEEEVEEDFDCLTEYLSPPLNRPFPILGMIQRSTSSKTLCQDPFVLF